MLDIRRVEQEDTEPFPPEEVCDGDAKEKTLAVDVLLSFTKLTATVPPVHHEMFMFMGREVPELNRPIETLMNTEAERWGQGKEANKGIFRTNASQMFLINGFENPQLRLVSNFQPHDQPWSQV
ncbi:hypothetical protein Q9233_008868 [Columba guinea]|nr:hypothetical protein Q9233_008868 [Columba guinea]